MIELLCLLRKFMVAFHRISNDELFEVLRMWRKWRGDSDTSHFRYRNSKIPVKYVWILCYQKLPEALFLNSPYAWIYPSCRHQPSLRLIWRAGCCYDYYICAISNKNTHEEVKEMVTLHMARRNIGKVWGRAARKLHICGEWDHSSTLMLFSFAAHFRRARLLLPAAWFRRCVFCSSTICANGLALTYEIARVRKRPSGYSFRQYCALSSDLFRSLRWYIIW